MTDETLRAAIAERGARAGGVVAEGMFREPLAVETKANKNDLVTVADMDAQRQVIATIHQEFPAARYVCEEESRPPNATDIELGDSVPDTGPAWVVDPIDGTSNYVRGMRFWATSVAAVQDGEPVAAATYMPAENDIYTAGPESVSRNDASMAVSDRDDPETFAVGLLGWWAFSEAEQYADLVRNITQRFGDVRRLGCMQGVLALVAAGSLEAAILPKTAHPWDTIAGVYLVRRAGGVATDIHGERWTPESSALVVTNDAAHDELLDAMRNAVELETVE